MDICHPQKYTIAPLAKLNAQGKNRRGIEEKPATNLMVTFGVRLFLKDKTQTQKIRDEIDS